MYSLQINSNSKLSIAKKQAGFIIKSTLAFVFMAGSFNANALEVFYDAQMDNYIYGIAKPLMDSSKVDGIRILIIKSPQINAFATQNKEVAIYSGLVEHADSALQVQGVLAHEFGHLMANHHIKSRVKNSQSGVATIAGTLLGVGAVIAGAPTVGMAAIVGTTSADISKQLAHSREHENEADSIAIKLLKENEMSPKGLADFFKVLQQQERLYFKAPPEFLNTHPNTARRKSFIQNNIVQIVEESKDDVDFDVFKAKLYAFTNPSKKVINKFSILDDSQAKSVALTVAYLNSSDFTNAKANLEKAKKQGMQDVWYYDLLGQIAYQESKFKDSVDYYLKSEKLGNDSWILDFQIAESYLAEKSDLALGYYFRAFAKNPEFPYSLKRISAYFAQNKQMANAHIYLAYYYVKIQDMKNAKLHLKYAQDFYKSENLNNQNLKNQIDFLENDLNKKNKDSK